MGWTKRFGGVSAFSDYSSEGYRSKTNEKHLADNGLRSRIHRKKPPGRPMHINLSRANDAKSKVRAAVVHVFAC